MSIQHRKPCGCARCMSQNQIKDVPVEKSQVESYSYYGDLNKRRYDIPERESDDWQGRP